MNRRFAEACMGAFVIFIAVYFVLIALNSGKVDNKSGYDLSADFDAVDGLSTGNDIRIGGIKIGTITKLELNKETYSAKVYMNVYEGINLPADSSAAIVSESLLGGKYVSITPGGEEEFLKEGESILFTQSSINLEGLLGKFAFGGDDDKTE